MLRRAAVPFALALAPLAAQDGDPILRQLPADATNVLVVRDVMPHVNAVLSSPELLAVATAAGDLVREEFGFDLRPAALQKQLGLFADFVPTEVVAATTPATVLSLAQAVRAAIAAVMLQHVREQDAIDAHRKDLTAALGAMTPPKGVAWLRLRNERVAERWFDQCVEFLEGLAATDKALQVKVEGQSLRVRVAPAMLHGEALLQKLRALGVDDAALTAFAAFELQASLDQQGDALRLRLGEPAAAPLPAAALGRRWRPDATQLLFLQVDAEAAQEVIAGILESNADVAMPAAMSGAAIAMQEALQRMASAGARENWAVHVDRGFTSTIESNLGDAIDDLDYEPAPQDLLRCIVAEDGPFMLASPPLDAILAGTLDAIQGQFARRANRPRYLELHKALTERGAKLIDYLGSEESAVFDPGVAIVTRAAACRSLRVGDHTITAQPFFGVAMIATAEDDKAAVTFVDRVTQLLAEACEIDGKGAWVEADLGLGVPTRSLQWQKMVPEQAGLKIDADFAPHHAQKHDVLILSTDPALTRVLLARMEGKAGAAAPPPKVITWSMVRGDQLAAVIAAVRSWTSAAREWPQAGDVDPVLAVLEVLEPLARLVESYESLLEFDGTWLRDVTALRLRPAAK